MHNLDTNEKRAFSRTVLVTGFDSFGGEGVNPSETVLSLLPDAVGSVSVHKVVLPTSYNRAPEALRRAFEDVGPSAVIMLGQAGGRRGVTPERVAINCMDGTIPDNDGVIMKDTPISEGGEAAYFSTLPIRRITEAVAALGIPSSISNTAGTFVCNRVMYEALRLTGGDPRIPAGFIHIPYLPEQTEGKPDGTPSLSLENAALAITAAIKVIFEESHEA